MLKKHDRATGRVLRQLVNRRTGGLASASGRAHKAFKDNQAILCQRGIVRRSGIWQPGGEAAVHRQKEGQYK
jgi:hypothetical protein